MDMNKKEIKKKISIGRRKTENKSKGRKKGGKDKDKRLNKQKVSAPSHVEKGKRKPSLETCQQLITISGNRQKRTRE